jgi:prepilin-type processing-associated H-X9-DG protein
VVFIPSAYARRVIEEFMPQLPENLGSGPSTVLTRGVSWAAVGIDCPPQGSLRVVIQSTDAQAADAMRVKLADLLRLAGEQKGIRKVLTKYGEVAAMLAPTVEGDRLVLTFDRRNQGFEKLVSALTPPNEVIAARRAQRQAAQNLKHIALAMHSYYGSLEHFPPPVAFSPDGKPLLSWRVSILPYLEEVSLFQQFHLDEPWDSPHNRTLIDKMPAFYRHPVSQAENGRTNYLLPVGNGAAFSADKPTKFRDITDGVSYTIMVAEVDDEHAAIWTKPDDWAFDPADPSRGLARFSDGDCNAAFFDGSVKMLSWPQTPEDFGRLRALFTCADGEWWPAASCDRR